MGKIENWLRSMPLRKAFVSFVLVMAVLVAGISVAAIYACLTTQQRLLDSVTVITKTPAQADQDEYNIIIADENQVTDGQNGELVLLSTEYRFENLTDHQRIIYYVAKIAVVAIPFLLFVVGTVLCAWLFYSIKLKQPLALLLQSSVRISQYELDFIIDYHASDEMGELCKAMDSMRSALQKNNEDMWSMMEERRKLNASISHDLRTPITILKGYTEYLSHNVPLGRISQSKLVDTLENLSKATGRLERYVNQVRDVQALDALPVKQTECKLRFLFLDQQAEFSLLTNEHQKFFSMNIEEIPDIAVDLDLTLTQRMIENAISNALRYAKQKVFLTAAWSENVLSIRIQDDGPGFSEEALKSAAQPFYKENSESDHFGLGLSICNTLCQKQGGTLKLSNQTSGGGCVDMQIWAHGIS